MARADPSTHLPALRARRAELKRRLALAAAKHGETAAIRRDLVDITNAILRAELAAEKAAKRAAKGSAKRLAAQELAGADMFGGLAA